MKASSFLRHIWVGCFICALFLLTTSIAYAHGGTMAAAKEDGGERKEVVVKQQQEPVKKKAEASLRGTSKDVHAVKPESKQNEVKKQESTSGFVSFNFLYYLFYKTNFAEATNGALRSSWNALVEKIFS